jgi:2-methylcitrate dehydratase PrpD
MRDAVLVNGALIHGIDFDDTHLKGVIHPTASAAPTALAICSTRHLSGKELLLAYVLAIETGARLGEVARGELNQLGFHPTGVIAAFSCTLAAGRLLSLSTEQLVMAQGIALSMAAGTREYSEDGAWTKRLHPGWAGVAGITAATLAKRGFIGPRRAYEGRFGLYATHLGAHGRDHDLAAASDRLGQRWAMTEIAIKPLPACHLAVAATEAAIEIAMEASFDFTEIREVEVRISPHAVAIVAEPALAKRRPQSTYAAQFSVYFLVACALARGRVGLSELELFRDPLIEALADRITYTVDPGDGQPHFGGEVIVILQNGRKMSRKAAAPRGGLDSPVSSDAIVQKFRDNASLVLPRERVDQLESRILTLEAMTDAQELAVALAMPAPNSASHTK